MSSLDYIKQDYLKIKAANSILKSRIDKVLRACKDDDENIYLLEAADCANHAIKN